jgi:hypothetical protein
MVGAGNSPAGENIGTTADTLMNGGANAATGALRRLGAFTPTGGTQSNIDAANSYADAAANPAAVDAAMRDARRQVSEQALPQVARSAALTGNSMSSKNAITQGIIERGLAEKGADVAATMRQDAFDKGLQLAEGGRQFDNSSILDALKSQGSLGASTAASGMAGADTSVDTLGKLFSLAQQGGAGEQAANQANLDNSIGKSDSTWDNLMKYYGIVGGNNWGGTTTGNGTTTSTPSIWQTVGGLMSAGGNIAGAFMKSDRRVKTDIYQIGTHEGTGLPVYTFRYKGDPAKYVHVGLMAQDVELVKPEAVKEIDGIKHVNYELALAE